MLSLRRVVPRQVGAPMQSSCTVQQHRNVSTGRFDHPPYSFRQRHTFQTLPIHDANYFGGRTAQLREIGPVNSMRRGRQFKRNKELAQYNVDIWCAQQTLRKRWKSRDWEVMELPFPLAPRELQRVMPEMYTDVPQPVDGFGGKDMSNVRSKVFDVETLQHVVYGARSPLLTTAIRRVHKDALTLDKFL
mmetsp:Transcript_27516/g.31712  ORF Transcript_27516/g.31712 Transcript_27516/m.31712 type:complete len:189 (-) Transcript_27516:82-648(-)